MIRNLQNLQLIITYEKDQYFLLATQSYEQFFFSMDFFETTDFGHFDHHPPTIEESPEVLDKDALEDWLFLLSILQRQ